MPGKRTKATATAGANIAFVKYWGNLNDELRIPMNGSISMTLDNARTTTSVQFESGLAADVFVLNERIAEEAARKRVSQHLDRIRELANVTARARVVSQNSFPTGVGIASSASGFAALTTAAAGALDLKLQRTELSRLARLGSGSACRSIHGGFVEWLAGTKHDESYAVSLAPAHYWELVDIVAIISREHKPVSSTAGHTLAHTSPFYQQRLETIEQTLDDVRQAILSRDFHRLGRLMEREAIQLHVASMTSEPAVLYWRGGTVNVMHALRSIRSEDPGLTGYFTMDAGANVHIITLPDAAPALNRMIKKIEGVEDTLLCGVGEAAKLIDSHLF